MTAFGDSVFQSLFFWNSRPDSIDDGDTVHITVFQSLFFWNSRPDLGTMIVEIPGGGFQSLFFWNSRPDILVNGFPVAVEVFQSLFFWNSRPDTVVFGDYVLFLPVSILVFLELAPGRGGGCYAGIAFRSFNPCFSGTRARTSAELGAAWIFTF